MSAAQDGSLEKALAGKAWDSRRCNLQLKSAPRKGLVPQGFKRWSWHETVMKWMSSWNFWQMFATCLVWVVFRRPWFVQGMSEDEVDAIRQESGLPGLGDRGKRRGRFCCLVGLPGGSPDTAEGGGRWKSGIRAAQKDRRRGTAENRSARRGIKELAFWMNRGKKLTR